MGSNATLTFKNVLSKFTLQTQKTQKKKNIDRSFHNFPQKCAIICQFENNNFIILLIELDFKEFLCAKWNQLKVS